MIKKTFKELKKIDEIHGTLLTKKNSNFKETKLGYAFKRFTEKSVKNIFSDYNNALQNIHIEYALVDEKTKALLYKEDGQSFQYSKEGMRALISGIKKLSEEWDSKEFEIEPFICNDIEGFGFTDEAKELLDGVIINVVKE